MITLLSEVRRFSVNAFVRMCIWPGADACRCVIKDSRDESPPKTNASDTSPAGRERGREKDGPAE